MVRLNATSHPLRTPTRVGNLVTVVPSAVFSCCTWKPLILPVARQGSSGQSACGLLLGSSPSSFGNPPHAATARTPATTSVAIVTRRFTLCHSTTPGGRSCGYAAPIDAFEQHIRASLHVLGNE